MNIKAKVFRNENYVCFTILEQDVRLTSRKIIFPKSSKSRYAVHIFNTPQLVISDSILYLRGRDSDYDFDFQKIRCKTTKEAENIYKKLVDTFKAINKMKLEEVSKIKENSYEATTIN